MFLNNILEVISVTDPPSEGDLRTFWNSVTLPRRIEKLDSNLLDHVKLSLTSFSDLDLSFAESFKLDRRTLEDAIVKSIRWLVHHHEYQRMLRISRELIRLFKHKDKNSSDCKTRTIQLVDLTINGKSRPLSMVEFNSLLKSQSISKSYFQIKDIRIPEKGDWAKEITLYWPTDIDDLVIEGVIEACSRRKVLLILEDAHIAPEASYSDRIYEVISEFCEMCENPIVTYRGSNEIHNILVSVVARHNPLAVKKDNNLENFFKTFPKLYERKLAQLIIALLPYMDLKIGANSLLSASSIWDNALPHVKAAKKDASTRLYTPWGWHKLGAITQVRRGKNLMVAPPELEKVRPGICAKAKQLAVACESLKQRFVKEKVTEESLPRLKLRINLLVQLSQSEKKWLILRPERSNDLLREMRSVLKIFEFYEVEKLEEEISAAIKGNIQPLEAALKKVNPAGGQ
jgi:hypothetical protein